MSQNSDGAKIARTAKGKRPQYFRDPAVDKLLAIVVSLVSEVSVMRDRMDAMERLIDRHDLFDRSEIDDFEVTPEIRAERDAWRSDYIARVFRVVQSELEQITLKREMRPLDDIIADFENEEV